MSARYRKPPLSYVTAKLQFSSVLPEKTQDQSAQLDQNMFLEDYIIKETSPLTQFEMQFNEGELSKNAPILRTVERSGFFNRNRDFAVILDHNSVEFRTSNYTEYEEFISKFDAVKDIIVKIIPAYGKAEIKESILSYVDIIVPDENYDYELCDFFISKTILPTHHYNNDEAVFLAAKNEYNELVNTKHRILISLEELPQKAMKFIPDILAELDTSFMMPINVSRPPTPNNDNAYVLLTTQAGQIHDKGFASLTMRDFFEQSHKSCRRVFDKFINRQVADIVWEKEK